MTGASVNFKAVKSAGHAVSHASREVAPTYLLPNDKSIGTVILLDDEGRVSQVLDAKMALASPRAKVDKRYSPVWEGILNLRRPEAGEDAEEYRAECSAVVTDWYKRYEASTGHKVLRVDVHLDEGHMVDGEAVLNAHAHVIADRTNDLGRVIKLSPKQLRELQTMTAEVTSLERGKSSFETGRKHINHHAYKHLAERGRLETQQVKGELGKSQSDLTSLQKLSKDWSDADLAKVKDLKTKLATAQLEADKVPTLQAKLDGEPARLDAALKAQEAQYRLDREALKASGTAKQADYQALKKANDEEIATLKDQLKTTLEKLAKAETEAAKVPKLEAQVVQAQAEIDRLTPLAGKVPGLEKDLATAQIEAATEARQLAEKLVTSEGKLGKLEVKHEAFKVKANDKIQEIIANANEKIGKLAEENTRLSATLTSQSNKPAVLTPARTPLQATKPAQEAPKPPEVPIPPTKVEKSLAERLKASWEAMVGWIRSFGAEQEVVTTDNSRYDGPVKHLDDLHAVQKLGLKYAIHKLSDLDKVPGLNDVNMVIRYKDGKGTVEGRLGKSGVER